MRPQIRFYQYTKCWPDAPSAQGLELPFALKPPGHGGPPCGGPWREAPRSPYPRLAIGKLRPHSGHQETVAARDGSISRGNWGGFRASSRRGCPYHGLTPVERKI